MKEKKKIFISCVEEDRSFIEVLHRDLENYGFETFWYAEDSPARVSFKNNTEVEIARNRTIFPEFVRKINKIHENYIFFIRLINQS